MPKIPAFLLAALQFREPQREALHDVTDPEWETVLSSWQTARLTLPLRQGCGDDLPDWVRSQIDTYLWNSALRFERIKAVYSTAAKALREADADHLVVKGFSLWPGYTEHPRSRPQSDIDLYCAPGSIFRARDALIALGYEPNRRGEHGAKDHLNAMIPKGSWEWRGNPFDPDIPISFELHFCLWNESLMRFCPAGLDQFWTRRIMRQLDDIHFPGLDSVDNLGYTALNVLRDLLRGLPAAEQVYGLARFLHSQADDRPFWRKWRELHDDSLRRSEAVAFHLASDWFGCRLPEEVQEEVDRLPAVVHGWFRVFSKSGLDPRFGQEKDGIWLHLNFLDSFADKASVLLRGLLQLPGGIPTFTSVFGEDLRSAQDGAKNWLSGALSFCRQSIQYAGWFVHRSAIRLAKLPFFLWRGLRFRLSTMNLGRQFWTFLAASFCFDLGMTIFFFLYNLYLLDRGFKEEFLGAMTSAMSIGSVACAIPAGMLVQRLGLRKALLFCLVLVPAVSVPRAVFTSKSALLALAFLSGFVTTIWAVAISPAIARLTSEQSQARGFSVVFSFGIGIGILAKLAASRMPGWLAHLNPLMSIIQAKQLTLFLGCAIVALGLLPVSRLKFPLTPMADKRFFPRNPFLLRFLPALAFWTLVTGSLSPLANVYFAQHLRMPLEHIGIVFSLSSLFQVIALLAAPFLFRKLGLVSAIASTQLATAIVLGCLAATSGAIPASVIYVAYTGLLWMSEPGLFSLLMSRVAPAEQAGASALNFLVISSAQAIAVAAAGASFARFGYPTALRAMAGVALTAAIFFRLMFGEAPLPPSQPLPAKLSS